MTREFEKYFTKNNALAEPSDYIRELKYIVEDVERQEVAENA